MAKFFGEIGYGISVDQGNGVWKEEIVKRKYRGDIVRNARRLGDGEKVNSDLTLSNSVSIVADAYAHTHFHAIRYVEWAGARWKVDNVEVQAPRLLLRLGGVYNA